MFVYTYISQQCVYIYIYISQQCVYISQQCVYVDTVFLPESWLSVFFGIEPAYQTNEINNPCLMTINHRHNQGVIRSWVVSN